MKRCTRNNLMIAAILSLSTVLHAQSINLISGNGAIGTLDPANVFSIDGGVTFTNAYIVSANSLYSTIPGTHWLSVQANAQGPSNITNIFQTVFTLPGGYTNPSLSIQILSDDQASVYLNGTLIGSQSFPTSTPNYTNPPSAFSTGNGSLFLTGQNVLTIRNYNQQDLSSNPTGIDYSAVVVPEPTTVAMTLCGLAGLFLMYRRRKV